MTSKKILRKLSAALLSTAMCFGFLVPVLAEGEGEDPSFAQTETMPVSDSQPSAGNPDTSPVDVQAAIEQEDPDLASDQTAETSPAPEDDSAADEGGSTDPSGIPEEEPSLTAPETDPSIEESTTEPASETTSTESTEGSSEKDGQTDQEAESESSDSEDAASSEEKSEEETSSKPVRFEQNAGQIHVTAKTTSDVLPEDAQMRVTQYSSQDAGYQSAEAALARSQVDYDGLVVVDISFWKDNQEIEPEEGSVDVEMSFARNLVDEEKKENSLKVHHISQTGNQAAQQVACEQTQTIVDDTGSYKAKFEVDSFSSFTISWKKYGTEKATFTMKMVDVNGNPLSSSQDGVTKTETDTKINFDEYGNSAKPAGYTYLYAQESSKTVTSVELAYSWKFGNEMLTVTFKNGSKDVRETDSETKFTVYLVYQKDGPELNVLNFDANGGSQAAPASLQGEQGQTVTFPDYTGTKHGYKFLGWSTFNNLDSTGYKPFYPVGAKYELTQPEQTLYAVWTPENARASAKFFIRQDGHIPDEPGHFPNGNYIGNIEIQNTVKETRWIVDTSHRAGEYDNQGNGLNGVTDKLNQLPTAAQIKTLLPDFDPETQYILWYVQKKENDGWHVDGVLLIKEKVSVSYDRNCSDTDVEVPMGYQRDPNTQITVGHDDAGTMVTPVRPGYIFLGWAKTPNPGPSDTIYHNGESYLLTEDTTFYAQWALDLKQLTVTKYIDGNMADRSKAFEFSVQIKDQRGNLYEQASTEANYADGWYTFSLSNGEQLTFEVPEGGTYQIKEDAQEYEPFYYLVTGSSDDSAKHEGSDTDSQRFNGQTAVIFHNVKQGSVPTGLHDDSNESSLMVTVGAFGFLFLAGCLYVSRKEREHVEH